MIIQTYKKLISKVARYSYYDEATVKKVMDAVPAVVHSEVSAGKRVHFKHFGVFRSNLYSASMRYNLQTKNTKLFPARSLINISVAKFLKRLV